MAINTKKVEGRRRVRYASYDEFLADAERLAQAEVNTLGNWTQAQIYEHLARSLNASIDGIDMSMPAPVRWVMTLLFKKKFLTKEIPPGFPSTGSMVAAPDLSLDAAMGSLRDAVGRVKQEPNRCRHPAFGDIGREGWDQFNMRHAEMHMSFLAEAL